ncbi:hypothetical protein SISNIDRAFT_136604 [Sistotremastrum niveocremeum HHB9708]|uniref:Uncharacterized protein n=1 Tax=Sistotremastrum niveocremeum HHB9708 TaxID=1314777 RepID=A0A164ZZ49_9AGAM|nr:hypothetical protein SISNIDRAFT_136604 [Sistotremastrum niveocremeum HHB9708]
MEPMTDINPKYMPVAHKSFLKSPFGHALEDDQETLESPKKPAKEKPAKGSLFDFFARKSKTCATPTPQMTAGRCSGARTLSTVNERSQIRGEQHQGEAVAANLQSRFFASPRSAKTTPKGKRRREASNTPVKNKRHRDLSDQENEPETVVEQEEGYLSPSPLSRRSWSNSSPLSSPGKKATPKVTDFTEFDVDPISSPVQRVELSNTSFIPPPRFSLDCIVGGVGNIQPRELHNHSVAFDAKAGPDLNDIFDDIRGSDEDLGDISVDSKGPITPESNPTPELSVRDPWDDLDDLEPEQSRETVQKRISDGWWNRYSLVSAETTRLTTAETPGSLFQNRTIRSTPTLATSTPSIRKKTELPTAPTTLKSSSHTFLPQRSR